MSKKSHLKLYRPNRMLPFQSFCLSFSAFMVNWRGVTNWPSNSMHFRWMPGQMNRCMWRRPVSVPHLKVFFFILTLIVFWKFWAKFFNVCRKSSKKWSAHLISWTSASARASGTVSSPKSVPSEDLHVASDFASLMPSSVHSSFCCKNIFGVFRWKISNNN